MFHAQQSNIFGGMVNVETALFLIYQEKKMILLIVIIHALQVNTSIGTQHAIQIVVVSSSKRLAKVNYTATLLVLLINISIGISLVLQSATHPIFKDQWPN